MPHSIALLDGLPLSAVFALTALLLIGSHQLGFRVAHASERRASPGQIGAIMPGVLALLSLLLAFTFDLANSEFADRRQAALDDVNAISTAWLRSRMLPAAEAEAMRALLGRYVEVRLEAAKSTTFAELEPWIAESETLHEQMWLHALASFRQEPRSIPVSLFVQSLNEVIDLHEKRLSFALRHRIAAGVWATLYFMALTSMVMVGAHARLTGSRGLSFAAVLLVLMLSAALTVTIDLDRPLQSLFGITQNSLLELKEVLQHASAATNGDN